jgi:hypothetical protein
MLLNYKRLIAYLGERRVKNLPKEEPAWIENPYHKDPSTGKIVWDDFLQVDDGYKSSPDKITPSIGLSIMQEQLRMFDKDTEVRASEARLHACDLFYSKKHDAIVQFIKPINPNIYIDDVLNALDKVLEKGIPSDWYAASRLHISEIFTEAGGQ